MSINSWTCQSEVMCLLISEWTCQSEVMCLLIRVYEVICLLIRGHVRVK